MIQSTKLLKNDIQEIAGEFELEVTGYQPLAQGANSNYLIRTNEGQHVLTVFDSEPGQIAQISKLLPLLEQHDFPAPRLKSMPNGKVVAKYQAKAVLIKSYIPGQVLEDLKVGQVKQVGAALAKLHKIPAPDYLPSDHTYVRTTYPQLMQQEMDQKYKKWVVERHSRMIADVPSNLPVGLVHGDLFCDNVLFEGQKFKAVLDFEDASRIYKVFDLGMAIVGICTDNTEIALEKARALVKGYQQIRSLEETEKSSLQDFIEWAAVLTSTWRFWAYNIDMPDPDMSRHYLQMVQIAQNARAIPAQEFNQAVFAG